MSSPETRAPHARLPSEAENAMAANARSRDRQGKAQDQARRERHIEMTGEVKGQQHLRQRGRPTARIGKAEDALESSVAPQAWSASDARQDTSADERAVDEGMGEPREQPRRRP